MHTTIADQLQGYQVEFLAKGQELEEKAESSPNPEAAHEWAQTLKDLSHTGVDTVEELDTPEQPDSLEDRTTDGFALGTRFSDIEKQELDPVWAGWIYRGVITGVIGEEGTGKSTLMSALAARISAGRDAPDGTPTGAGTVIYISPEEFDDVTVIDRLELEGANLNNVITMQDILDEPFKLPTHLDFLKAAIIHYKASLVVIDPINSCVGKGHTINTIQGAIAFLSPLQRMLRQVQCGLVFINHFTKSKSGSTSDRGSGSKGIYNFLRIYCTLSVDIPTGKVLLHEDKNNLRTGTMKKPPDLYIEKLKSGKLFFSGAGNTADFRVMTENERLSMGGQAIIKILDSDPFRDFPSAIIHQTLLGIYPSMPPGTTKSLLSRMSDRGFILKIAWNTYCSAKRPGMLAEMQRQKEDEQEKGGVSQIDATSATPATSATSATNPDVAKQATMVL
jgi:hypothetical protein